MEVQDTVGLLTITAPCRGLCELSCWFHWICKKWCLYLMEDNQTLNTCVPIMEKKLNSQNVGNAADRAQSSWHNYKLNPQEARLCSSAPCLFVSVGSELFSQISLAALKYLEVLGSTCFGSGLKIICLMVEHRNIWYMKFLSLLKIAPEIYFKTLRKKLKACTLFSFPIAQLPMLL